MLHTLLKACSSVTTSGASPPPFTAMAFSLHFSANCCGVTFWAAPSAIVTSALSPPVVSLDFCLQLAVNANRHSSVMNNFFISQVLIISIQLLILQIYHFILRNRPFIPLFYTIPPSSQRKAPITPAPYSEEEQGWGLCQCHFSSIPSHAFRRTAKLISARSAINF